MRVHNIPEDKEPTIRHQIKWLAGWFEAEPTAMLQE
jgi:hypothetical protein